MVFASDVSITVVDSVLTGENVVSVAVVAIEVGYV